MGSEMCIRDSLIAPQQTVVIKATQQTAPVDTGDYTTHSKADVEQRIPDAISADVLRL